MRNLVLSLLVLLSANIASAEIIRCLPVQKTKITTNYLFVNNFRDGFLFSETIRFPDEAPLKSYVGTTVIRHGTVSTSHQVEAKVRVPTVEWASDDTCYRVKKKVYKFKVVPLSAQASLGEPLSTLQIDEELEKRKTENCEKDMIEAYRGMPYRAQYNCFRLE